MATSLDDVARTVGEFPGVTEEERRGSRTWLVAGWEFAWLVALRPAAAGAAPSALIA